MIKFYDCDFCAHKKGFKDGHCICEAFPDGVPYEHAYKELKKVKECNNGIKYMPMSKEQEEII